MFSEEQLSKWAAAPSVTERERMENAERAVREAISACSKLAEHDITVFAQGSYRNRVNVRQDSDVDVAVVCKETFGWVAPEGATLETLGYEAATYSYSEFRKDVGAALASYFKGGVVTPGDKAFDIKANSYRVEADVAPFIEHKRFDEYGQVIRGVELRPTSGGRIINFPDQHYENGVAKNDRTGRCYKGCVRILKSLRYRMIEAGIDSAGQATSFLAECLIWNVPDDHLGHPTWTEDLRHCLAFLFNNTMNYDDCSEWGEVSELKYLFHAKQPWTWQGSHQFISDCWDYVGFE